MLQRISLKNLTDESIKIIVEALFSGALDIEYTAIKYDSTKSYETVRAIVEQHLSSIVRSDMPINAHTRLAKYTNLLELYRDHAYRTVGLTTKVYNPLFELAPYTLSSMRQTEVMRLQYPEVVATFILGAYDLVTFDRVIKIQDAPFSRNENVSRFYMIFMREVINITRLP